MSGLSLPRSSSPSVHSTSPTETTPPATTTPNVQTPPTPTQQNSEQFAGLRRSRSASESRSGTAQPGQGRRRTASLSGPSTASATSSAPTLSSLAATVAAEHDVAHDAAAQELEAPPTPHTEQAPATSQTVAREPAVAAEETAATEKAVAREPAPATTQTVANEQAPATEQAVAKEKTPEQTPATVQTQATVQTPADTAPSVQVPERPLTLHQASSESDLSRHVASGEEMTRPSSAGATPASTAPLELHAPVVPLAPPPSETALQEKALQETAPKETVPKEAALQETTTQKTAPQEIAKAVESAPSAKQSEPATPLAQVPERSLTLHQASSESDLPMEEAPSSTPAPAMTRSSSTGATAASTAPLAPLEPLAPLKSTAPLEPPAAPSIHVTVPQETSTTPATQNDASSSKTVTAETSTTPPAQPEASTSQEVAGRKRSESTTTVRDFAYDQKLSSSSLETKQPMPEVTVSAPAVESAPAALSTASSTPASTDVAPAPLSQTPLQTPLQTPQQAHLAPPLQQPAHKPAIATTQATASSSSSSPLEIVVEPRVPAQTHQQGTLADPKVQSFVKQTRIAARQSPPTSTVQLGNRATGRNATAVDNDIDLEAGGPPVRQRFDQTRSRIGAFTKPVMSLVRGAPAALAATPGMLMAAPGALKAGLIRVKNNDFGEDQPWLGWSANVVNTVVHELMGTGGTTALREMADMGMEALIEATGMTPAHQAIGVGVIFGAAVAGNVAAMYHKSKKGTATRDTYQGHMIQISSLLLSATAAGLVGKNGKKGPILAQILPQALKSVVYLTRDLYNLQFPLEGNHDNDYNRPILGQSYDVLYGGVEMAVNAAQDRGLGGSGVLEALKGHTMGLKEIIGKQVGYDLANAGGESIANISVRVANEIATHGPGSKEALKGIRDLRLSWGKFSAEQSSKGSQLVDKLEGAATARLSLFLSLYAFSGVLGHLLEKSSLSPGAQQALEEVLGGIEIFAGCIPFAMSTSGKSANEEEALSDVESDAADNASVTITPADPDVAPERLTPDPSRLSPNTATLRPQNSSSSSASINTVSTVSSGRPSFEVV